MSEIYKLTDADGYTRRGQKRIYFDAFASGRVRIRPAKQHLLFEEGTSCYEVVKHHRRPPVYMPGECVLLYPHEVLVRTSGNRYRPATTAEIKAAR